MDLFISKLEHLDQVNDAYRRGFLSGFAGGATMVFIVVAAILLGGCGDNEPPLYRDALVDMVAETREYAERCGLEAWQVNDYERLVCGWEECGVEPDGDPWCWEQEPVMPCDALFAPLDWDFDACAKALAELECQTYGVDLPAACRVLVPWERGQ